MNIRDLRVAVSALAKGEGYSLYGEKLGCMTYEDGIFPIPNEHLIECLGGGYILMLDQQTSYRIGFFDVPKEGFSFGEAEQSFVFGARVRSDEKDVFLSPVAIMRLSEFSSRIMEEPAHRILDAHLAAGLNELQDGPPKRGLMHWIRTRKSVSHHRSLPAG